MDNIERYPIIIPKQLKTISNLYRLCKFEEADRKLDCFNKLPHQVAYIKAQLSFFQWNFDITIKFIMEYYEYLYEWYSRNSTDETVLMLEFALLHCSTDVKENTLKILKSIFQKYTEEERKDENLFHIRKIPQIIDIANGKLQWYIDNTYSYYNYDEPQFPLNMNEIVQEYTEIHKKEFPSTESNYLHNGRFVDGVLSRIREIGKANDFIALYEMNKTASEISMYTSMDAVRIYMYLNEYEKAKQAIVDLVKYRWRPVEWTDVMPLSALVGLNCFDLFDKDLFETIFNVPKGVDQDSKNESERLRFKHNFDELFEQTEFAGFTLTKKVISKISVPSGKLIVADPLVYLDSNTIPYIQKVPKGEYDVVALFATNSCGESAITAVKVSFSNIPAVVYRNALTGKESQVEINDLEEDGYFGFHVDGGLVTIIDDKIKKEYLKFQHQWERKNKGADFYTGYLMDKFTSSAKEFSQFQRECGDYIDLTIPDTDYHIPMFSSGAGDGYYPVYFGYNSKNKVCSIVVEFIGVY